MFRMQPEWNVHPNFNTDAVEDPMPATFAAKMAPDDNDSDDNVDDNNLYNIDDKV